MQAQKHYDELFMQYTFSLARKGWGKTGVNPLVGTLIVKNNRVIGQGYHRKIGEMHAEICALIDAGTRTNDATLYVNLEPCCYVGRTPPCVEAICHAKIKRVVIGTIDPNPAVNGKGIDFLKQNNIAVTLNILKEQADNLNVWYKKYITEKIPYIIVKIAASQDKKISGFKEKYITSQKSRTVVHALRSQVSAVLVGINTVIEDNPLLTDRLIGRNNPARVVIDPHLKIPLEAHFLKPDSRRIIITDPKNNRNKIEKLSAAGIEFLFLDGQHYLLPTITKKLGTFNVGSLLIEGGGQVFTEFLNKKLYDELYYFVAPQTIGKGLEVNVDENLLRNTQPAKIGEDLLYHVYRNNRRSS